MVKSRVCSVTSNYSRNRSSVTNPNYADKEDRSSYYIKSECGRISFVVGGLIHTVLLDSLYSDLPASRLGRLVRAKTKEEVLSICDKFDPGDELGPVVTFDRTSSCFNTILDIYRYGLFHVCDSTCATIRKGDLEFWQIDELLMEPCCALKYYPDIEICDNETLGEMKRKEEEEIRMKEEDFGDSCFGRLRTFFWNMTEYPESGKPAQVMAFFSLGMVFVSTFTFIMSTLEEFDGDSETGEEEYETVTAIIAGIDHVCATFFAVEYFVRLFFCPRKVRFILDKMNLVDVLAIIPFFITLILENLEDFVIIGKAGKIIRLVRVMRIMRIFKLVRHFAGLQSLIHTLGQAYKELGLLTILIGVAILTGASFVYFAEKDESGWTFLDAFWFSLMTLTTVGYDMHPTTFIGKLTGGMCALLGIFILTLPIPIVVNSFTTYYKNRLWRNEVAHKKSERMRILKSESKNSIKSLNNRSSKGSNIIINA